MKVIYYLNGVDLSKFGVHVKSSEGLLGRPKIKEPDSFTWPEQHGKIVNLDSRYYEERKIQLDCFITAASAAEFVTKLYSLCEAFETQGSKRLMVSVDATRPLLYEVYLANDIQPKKEWRSTSMVGTFTLELIEAQPIKRVIKFIDSRAMITISCSKAINISWGDGTWTYDIIGNDISINKMYSSPDSTYYAIIAGDVDSITKLTIINGEILWNKL